MISCALLENRAWAKEFEIEGFRIEGTLREDTDKRSLARMFRAIRDALFQ